VTFRKGVQWVVIQACSTLEQMDRVPMDVLGYGLPPTAAGTHFFLLNLPVHVGGSPLSAGVRNSMCPAGNSIVRFEDAPHQRKRLRAS